MLKSVVAFALATVQDTPTVDWGKLFASDLEAAEQITLDNHPAAIDEADKASFLDTLKRAMIEGRARTAIIEGPLGYSSAMAAFSATFRDNHFKTASTPQFRAVDLGTETGSRWPGFVAAWHDDLFTIIESEVPQVEVGGTISQCDGRPATVWVRDTIFAYTPADPANPSNWSLFAPNLFNQVKNPAIGTPEVCNIVSSTGTTTEVALDWQPAPDDIWQRLESAKFGAAAEISLKEVEPGIWWIQLGTFHFQNAKRQEHMDTLLSDLAENSAELIRARAIVFDLTGNQGGNSIWARRVLETVYGKRYVEALAYGPEVYVDWRVTDGTIAAMEGYREVGIKRGDDRYVAFTSRTIEGLERAQAAGKQWFSTRSTDVETAAEPLRVQSPVKSRSIILTDGRCASACLDFMDMALGVEGITHAGYTTSADSNYMDVRGIDLPSGYAMLTMPMKVFRNRPRASGEYYTPSISYTGDDWSLEQRVEWVIDIVGNDHH
ncbi:hypothetical protein [Altererythrobacter sp. ZODW24]|uniref:hypothetical protein n=1 Tax=Altererythrobacter sp. ZODW24 TaxID=2185142 RepID=UPI000DF7E09D|nr:hypothetical protein [Altererythrobacter sp. ZODW24]